MPVTQERTGWRDERISLRHRMWGIGCTTTDFDFLMLEYEFGNPSAIVEYKHEYAEPQSPLKPQYQALIKLGNSAKIPVMACRYSDDFTRYTVTPLNEFAVKFVPKRIVLDEMGWVSLLYKIRGHEVTPEFLAGMKVEI